MQEAHVPTAVSCTCLKPSFITVSLFSLYTFQKVWHVLSCSEYEESEHGPQWVGGWGGKKKREVEKAHTD